jgi:DNA-binding NarL/FixJ family response regulator
MENKKKYIGIACNNTNELTVIRKALLAIESIEIILFAFSGKDLILKIGKCKKRLDLVFINLDLVKGEAIATVTVCKYFNRSLSFIGYSKSYVPNVVSNLFSEGGDGFLTTSYFEMNDDFKRKIYQSDASIYSVFEKIDKHIPYIDPICKKDFGDIEKTANSFTCYQENFLNVKKENFIILQLTAINFSKQEIEKLVHLSIPAIKRITKDLFVALDVKNKHDLATTAFFYGIVKLVQSKCILTDTQVSNIL